MNRLRKVRGPALRRNYPDRPLTVWVVLRTSVSSAHQAMLVRVCGGSRARRQIEFGEDIAHVAVNGPFADGELPCDLTIAFARRDQLDDLPLARRQQSRIGRGGSQNLLDARDIGRGAEPQEDVAGRLEFQVSGLGVTQLPPAETHGNPNPGSVVRNVQALPFDPGAAQRLERVAHLTFSEENGSPRVRAQGAQVRNSCSLGEPHELVRGASRSRMIPRCDRDLDR